MIRVKAHRGKRLLGAETTSRSLILLEVHRAVPIRDPHLLQVLLAGQVQEPHRGTLLQQAGMRQAEWILSAAGREARQVLAGPYHAAETE